MKNNLNLHAASRVINRRKLGAEKELLAAEYLKANGYQILEQNYFTRSGEIDLIAKESGYLVFLEVKYRKDTVTGHPEEAVTYQKQQRIIRAARYYMLTHGFGEYTPCRFDVVAITGEKVRVIKNAFGI